MTIAFERLTRRRGRARAHEWLAELRPRERAPDDRPFLYLNMVASADGRASVEGRAAGLGSEADTLLLTELRAVAEAVLVGTGTIRAEGYGRLVRNAERVARREAAGMAATPTAVLISRSFDIPWDARLFAAADQPVIVYTGARGEPPEVAAPVEVVRLADPAPRAVMADLRARGVRSLLCEGGPTLNSALLEAGRRRRAVPDDLAAAHRRAGGAADRRGRGPPRAGRARARVGAAPRRRALPPLRGRR